MGHRRHTGLQPVRPNRHPHRQTDGHGSEFRLLAVFLVIATISNLNYPNVRKCPVLSGLLNAIPVTTINPMYQQDLQQFYSCSRPDIPDIRPAAGLLRVLLAIFATSRLVWFRLRLRCAVFSAFCPMSGNVRFCPVFVALSPSSPSTPCTNRTYSNFHRPADRTYQTFARKNGHARFSPC